MYGKFTYPVVYGKSTDPVVYGKSTDPVVYGKFTDPVEFGKFEPRDYAYYVNSYYYSIGNCVYYLTNYNDLGDYVHHLLLLRTMTLGPS